MCICVTTFMKLQGDAFWSACVPGYLELNAARDDASFAGIPQTPIPREWLTQLVVALKRGNYDLKIDDHRLLKALALAEYIRLQKLGVLPQVPPDLQVLVDYLKDYTAGSNVPYTEEEHFVLCALRVMLGKGARGREEPCIAHFRLLSQRATGPLKAQLVRFFPL